MLKRFLKSEKGDTNIVSLLIVLAVVVIAFVIFKPYVAKLFSWLLGLFG